MKKIIFLAQALWIRGMVMENQVCTYTLEHFKESAESIGLDLDEYMEILNEFVLSALSDIQKLYKSIENKDYSSLAYAAHSLKGSAGNMNLRDIQGWALEAEDLGKSSKMDGLEVLVKRIEKSIYSLKENISK